MFFFLTAQTEKKIVEKYKKQIGENIWWISCKSPVLVKMFQTLPKFDANNPRKPKDYIGLYLGIFVYTATGAKVKLKIVCIE